MSLVTDKQTGSLAQMRVDSCNGTLLETIEILCEIVYEQAIASCLSLTSHGSSHGDICTGLSREQTSMFQSCIAANMSIQM